MRFELTEGTIENACTCCCSSPRPKKPSTVARLWTPSIHLHLARHVNWAASFAVVGTIDNILRPMLVGREAALLDLMILISTLGGLVVFGAVGLVLGPVVAALFVSL